MQVMLAALSNQPHALKAFHTLRYGSAIVAVLGQYKSSCKGQKIQMDATDTTIVYFHDLGTNGSYTVAAVHMTTGQELAKVYFPIALSCGCQCRHYTS